MSSEEEVRREGKRKGGEKEWRREEAKGHRERNGGRGGGWVRNGRGG